jgi:HEAT repeat protein
MERWIWVVVAGCAIVFGARARAQAAQAKPIEAEGVQALEHQLKAGKPEERRRAVRKLAAIGQRESWSLVIAALADRASEVGDEAQLALAGLREPRTLELLLGRAGLDSREERVPLRVAEALGRFEVELDCEALARHLFDRDPELVRMLLWSVERLERANRLSGDRDRLRASVAQVRDHARDGGTRAVALLAWRALAGMREDPLLARRIEEAARDRDPRVRCAALQAAAGTLAASVLAVARPLAADPESSVRAQAIESLEALRSREGVLALVDRLDSEPRERLRWRVVETLQGLSNLKYRADPRPWRLWAEGLPPSWSGEPALPASSPAQEAGSTQAAGFAGMPVRSDRVYFLIDFSGSMWTPMKDGRMPKELVDVHLRQALEALPPTCQFNVLPFTNEPLPWRERLVEAKPANVKAAVEEFTRCTARGKGNFFDAALVALEDPGTDTVITLTDGVPTGGLHSDMDLIVPLLLERNRFRKVVFDSILVDAPGQAQRRWAEFSRRTGGRSIAVQLK